jgi:hypothetical protein
MVDDPPCCHRRAAPRVTLFTGLAQFISASLSKIAADDKGGKSPATVIKELTEMARDPNTKQNPAPEEGDEKPVICI